MTAEDAAAAPPRGAGETALLNLRLELVALLANVVVLEAERARELDECGG